MANFFGGKDPFDDPFFTQPFGGLFCGKSPFDDPFFTRQFTDRPGSRKKITIEELNPDGDDVGNDVWQNSKPDKQLSVKNSNEYPTGEQSFSFQRVSCGGPDGWYYTSSIGRRMMGGDGVVLMEMKEEDKMSGESLHTVSKGIHDKGHSVTTKQRLDGQVDSLQTLHNLNEDELSSFEETWKSNADQVLPGWSSGFNLLENAGVNNGEWDPFANWGDWDRWPLPTLEYFGNGESSEAQRQPSGGKSRKVVPVE